MNRRRRKLIEPRLQLRFALFFLTAAAASALVQTIVFGYMLNRVASSLPNDGVRVFEQIPEVLRTGFIVTFALLVPVMLVAGIRTTFPIVGPLYRFRTWLRDLARGEATAPCKIRKGDELQDLCDLLNEATAPLLTVNESARDAA